MAKAKPVEIYPDEEPPRLADLIEPVSVEQFMENYDQRRLLGYGGHPSDYRLEGKQLYIATICPTTGAPLLDVVIYG